MRFFTPILLLTLFGTSCNDESFIGGQANPPEAANEESAEAIPAIPGEEEVLTVEKEDEPPTPDENALALQQCLDQWENHPFSAEEIANPNLYMVNKDKANGDIVFSDKTPTEIPVLNLVVIGLNVANKGVAELENDNGWYCLYFTGRIANNFTIYQSQNNMLATVSRQSQTANNFEVIRR